MSTVSIDNVTYTLNSGDYTASVTGNTLNVLTNVIIPETITDTNGTSYTVTSISYLAFNSSSYIASVVIPDSVTIINNGIANGAAFRMCSNMTSVTIGNAVTSIGNFAFYNCTTLTSIYFLGDKPSIANNNTFLSTNSLTLYYVDGATGWSSSVAGKTAVAITAGTTGVASITAFSNTNKTAAFSIADSNYTNVELVIVNGASGVTSGTAFALSNGSWTVTSPALADEDVVKVFLQTSSGATVSELLRYTYDSATNYYSVDLGVGISSIDTEAFYACSNLTAVTIGANVTSIGNQAFIYCSQLSSVTIPDAVTSIGGGAFASCSKLTSVTIPDAVTSIDDSTFDSCSQLTSVTIGNAVTSIGNYAFESCSELTSVTIGSSVTSIGICAFETCSELTAVTIPDAVTSIGDSAFNQCSELTSVTIGSNVTSIGIGAFQYCSSLISLPVSQYNTVLYNDPNDNGVIYKIVNGSASLYLSVPTKESYTMLSTFNGVNVTSISSHAFYYDASLSHMVLADSITLIGESAFQSCTSLTNVIIPANVTTIESRAFVGASILESVYFLGAKPTIGEYAFYGINASSTAYYLSRYSSSWVSQPDYIANLATFTISDLRLAGYSASVLQALGVTDSDILGAGYTALQLQDAGYTVTVTIDSVTYTLNTGNTASVTGNTLSALTNVIIPATISDTDGTEYSVTSIGSSAFKLSSHLASVVIPNSVTIINDGNATIGFGAFFSCSELTSVTIGSSVTSIGDSAFESCSKLAFVTIGTGLTTMGYGAFQSCGDTLKSMYFLGAYPSSGIDSNTFTGDSSLTVYYVDGASDWTSTVGGKDAYHIPTITSATSSSVSISADSALSTVYVYTSTDSGTTWTTNSVEMSGGSGTLINLSSGTLVSTIANVYDTMYYADYCQTITNSIPTPSSNVCFPAKTPVLTNQGPVNIEDINPAVHTIRNKKIVAITKTVAHDKNLVRIAKHALGHLYPEKTTFISQNHKVFFQGQMVKAKHLVDEANGVTLVPYNGQVLYNVLLAEHEKMQVNNLIVETLHPEHKVAKLYRFLKNVDAAHHGKLIALFNKCDRQQRLRR